MANKHRHTCACGTVLICAQAPDACAVIEPFDCPTCLQIQRDEFFQNVANIRAEIKAAKESVHADHR